MKLIEGKKAKKGIGGEVLVCYELDEADLKELIETKKIWVCEFTFNRQYNPVMLLINPMTKKRIKNGSKEK